LQVAKVQVNDGQHCDKQWECEYGDHGNRPGNSSDSRSWWCFYSP